MVGMIEGSWSPSFKLLVYVSEQFLFPFYAIFYPSFCLFVKTNRGRSVWDM